MDDKDLERLRKLLSPEKYTCPACDRVYLNRMELAGCVEKHAREEALRRYEDEMLKEVEPEPDEGLIAAMEALTEVENDNKNKISR